MRSPLARLVARAVPRRTFLQASAAVASSAFWGPSTQARGLGEVAIVGAGLAGLSAAYLLQQRGLQPRVFEAAARLGGRILTLRDRLGSGLQTELGAEFIDTGHTEIRSLCRVLGLPLIDLEAGGEAELADYYLFEGQGRSEAEIAQALEPYAARFALDEKRAAQLDQVSLAEYLESLKLPAWLHRLLQVAYVSEFGLDTQDQSCLNLLYFLKRHSANVVGDTDIRFKIAGGNSRLPQALAARLKRPPELEHRLLAVRPDASGYLLSFHTAGGPTREVRCGAVILTLPFTLLRQVELGLELPARQREAIQHLGYGTNAKLIYGVDRRVWRDPGFSGSFYSDLPRLPCGWDSSRGLPGRAGTLTVFLGGQEGQSLVPQARPELFAGLESTYNGRYQQICWAKQRYAQGSYAGYRPGQWTRLWGHESTPCGRVFFAGEHTSPKWQGYMNGAVESAYRAVSQLLQSR